MSEPTNRRHNEQNSNVRSVVPAHLYRRRHDKRRSEESIVVNPVNLVQYNNFVVGLPLWQPRQMHNFNLACGSLVQPHLSQNYFHRQNHQVQRQLQTTSNQVGENSIGGLRFWEKISEGNKSAGFIFTIMCYNVLAQDLLDQHPQLYQRHHPNSLKWRTRWRNLLNEIRHFGPEILCLQEVQKSHLGREFLALEQLGYSGLYKQRTGIRTDGCAIYFKHALVNLIEYTTVEYKQPNVRILDRDNVAIIAKFSPKSHPEKEFVVATTHLLYNPKRQDVRLAQTQLLLTEIDRIAFTQRNRYIPVIVTGDLNSTPDSAVYSFITKGKLRYENLSERSLQNGNNGPKTGKQFLPTSLRITDRCQHADLLPARTSNGTISRTEELKLIELKHSERQCEVNKQNQNGNDKDLFSSGTLSHNFCLRSVYQHSVNGDTEGTTYQDKWISVDYIFYSKPLAKADELILLERYRLPTASELKDIKIPNANLGSDHLSLIAKFQLQV